MDDEVSTVDDSLETKLVNLGKAVAAFLPHFGNLRKVRDRLLGDVADAAFDTMVSRLRLYQTSNRAETIRIAIDRTGLPPSAVHEMFDRQENIDTLVASALEHMAQNTNQPEEAGKTDITSDDEWFDVFRREAADRSAGEMREAFVRVLAGEIQKPGKFSVQTLRVLGAISTTTAANFRRAASVCIATERRDARVPAVGGQLGENCLQDIGLSYDVLTGLTENGLVHPDYSCYMPYGPLTASASTGMRLPLNVQKPFRHQGKRWVLLGTTDQLKRKTLRVQGAAFTQAGRELLEVVDIEALPEFTERLKEHFARSHYRMIEVAANTKFYFE